MPTLITLVCKTLAIPSHWAIDRRIDVVPLIRPRGDGAPTEPMLVLDYVGCMPMPTLATHLGHNFPFIFDARRRQHASSGARNASLL